MHSVDDRNRSAYEERGGTTLHRRKRAGIITLAIVLLLALLAGMVATLRAVTPSQTRHPHEPVALDIFPRLLPCTPQGACPGDPICPAGTAWASDDLRIAILDNCYQRGASDAVLLIYDTQSGKLLLDISLLSILLRLPNTPVPGHNTPSCPRGGAPSIHTDGLVWSRDGRRLDIPFEFLPVNHTLAGGDCHGWAGLLLMSSDGGSPRAFYHGYSGRPSPAGLLPGQCYGEWDMETGAFISARLNTSPAGQQFNCLSPALSYTWGLNGALLPETPLPRAEAPAAPAPNACPPPGNPNGDATVSIWQPGGIERLAEQAPYQNQPPIYGWYTSFTAVSPDGRYLADKLFIFGLFHLPGLGLPGAAAAYNSGVSDTAVLPMPGRFVEQRVEALPATAESDQAIVPRPDGRVIAVSAVAMATTFGVNSQPLSNRVVLYDCASGRALATLAPVIDTRYASPANQGIGPGLHWSPDGKYFLDIDRAYGAATIWGPDQLPH